MAVPASMGWERHILDDSGDESHRRLQTRDGYSHFRRAFDALNAVKELGAARSQPDLHVSMKMKSEQEKSRSIGISLNTLRKSMEPSLTTCVDRANEGLNAAFMPINRSSWKTLGQILQYHSLAPATQDAQQNRLTTCFEKGQLSGADVAFWVTFPGQYQCPEARRAGQVGRE